MKEKIEKAIVNIKFSQLDDSSKYNFSISVFRTILGYAAISAITVAESQAEEENISILKTCAQKMLRPADGDLIFILDSTLPILWESGLFPETKEWFRSGASKKCGEIVFERNNRLGHGVFDEHTAAEWSKILDRTEEIYQNINALIPKEKNSTLSIQNIEFGIQFPTEHPCCLRSITLKSDSWRYIYQVLNFKKSNELTGYLDLKNPLIRLLSENRNLLATKIITNSWRPSFILPQKQTALFLGRSEQLEDLKDWWDDEFSSRICLVYGEGGIGKTTLALEFLNRILDEEIEVEWKPDYIFFFSSKQTRWGVNGLEKIAGVKNNLTEAVISLISALEIIKIDQRWHSLSPNDVISKASQIINDIGLKNKILFVIDNAENLVRNSQDESDLAALIKTISRKIGRVIVTSRRREKFGGEQIQVLALDDNDGALLLQELLQGDNKTKIPESHKIKEYIRRIGGKPILIEFLAKYTTMTNTPLERGVEEILRQESGDLGNFLFADSWGRISEENRCVFMAIAQLGGFVDEILLSMLTSKLSVRKDEWSSAYEETRYGESNFYSGKQEIILDEGARSFIAGRYQNSDKEIRKKVDAAAQKSKAEYSEYLQNQRTEIKDRIEKAFIHPLARQAKIATVKGEIEKAKGFYEQAIVSDASNPYLYDRFAWFTMKHLGDHPVAESLAKRAWDLENKDIDVNFTLGMVYARQGEVENAEKYLSLARKYGKERHLVQLQIAHSRYTAMWKKKIPASEFELNKINRLLDDSIIGSPKTNQHNRHNEEVKRLRIKSKNEVEKNK